MVMNGWLLNDCYGVGLIPQVAGQNICHQSSFKYSQTALHSDLAGVHQEIDDDHKQNIVKYNYLALLLVLSSKWSFLVKCNVNLFSISSVQYMQLSRSSGEKNVAKIRLHKNGYATAWREATRLTECLYLAVRLRLLHITWLCCLVVADLVIDGWGRIEAVRLRGGQKLYCRGNQTSLVPHGQQDIMVLLPGAPGGEGCRISTVLYLLFLFFNL